MNNTTEKPSSILKVTVKVQIDRSRPLKDSDWKSAIAVGDYEASKLVSSVLPTFLERRSKVFVHSSLIKTCKPTSCGQFATSITITPPLEPSQEKLVLGSLRQLLYDKLVEYGSFGVHVAWLTPNISSTLIGWQIDGPPSLFSPKEQHVFADEARLVLTNSSVNLDHICDSVFVLRQFIRKNYSIEIHSALLGSSANDDTRSYQDKALQLLNNKSDRFFYGIDRFRSVTGVKAFALNSRDITEIRVTPTEVSTKDEPKSPIRHGLPFTINTTNLAIALAILAVFVQICAAVVVVVRRKSMTRAMNKTEQDDKSEEACSDEWNSKCSL